MVWESPFGLGWFSELPVNRLNGVGRVNDPANILRILEKLAEPIPLVSPGFDDNWIFAVPLVFKLV